MRNRSVSGVYSGSISIRPFLDEPCCWPGCERITGVIDAPLCKPHLIKVYVICQETYLWMMEPDPAEVEELLQPPVSRRFGTPAPPEQGVVYFVRLGNLVKIGFTTDMTSRMKAIPHEEILGTTPGTMADEKRCHAAFAHLRVKGEWFRPEPDLMAFIADVAG